jgi:hypothetical protein
MTQPLDYATYRFEKRPPTQLMVAAWIFIAFGVLAAGEMAWALFHGRLSLNIGVIGIWIGRGLLRMNPTARYWALVVLSLQLILAGVVTLLIVANRGGVVRFGAIGLTADTHLTQVIALGLTTVAVTLNAWQLWVLTRPHIRQLFDPPSRY